jgi:tetratricopeptide (TPR) repeat protein
MTGADRQDSGALERELERELERIRQLDAHGILGLRPDADGEAVRRAFFDAARRYHPSRFARCDRQVVRLANEVFLAFKAAYASISVAAGVTASAPPDRAPTGPRAEPVTAPAVAVPARAARAGTVQGVPPVAGTASPAARAAGRSTGPVPSAPPSAAPARGKATEPGAAAGPDQVNSTAPGRGKPVSPAVAAVVRARAERARAVERGIAEALALIGRGEYEAARKQLHALAATDPADRVSRVHLHYAWAREYAAAGNPRSAQAEYEAALRIDPEFALARSGLAELSARPRRPGLMSKLFGGD